MLRLELTMPLKTCQIRASSWIRYVLPGAASCCWQLKGTCPRNTTDESWGGSAANHVRVNALCLACACCREAQEEEEEEAQVSIEGRKALVDER